MKRKNPIRAEYQVVDNQVSEPALTRVLTKKKLGAEIAEEIKKAGELGIPQVNIAGVIFKDPLTGKLDSAWSCGVAAKHSFGEHHFHFRLEHEQVEQEVQRRFSQKIFERTGRQNYSSIRQFVRVWASFQPDKGTWKESGGMAFAWLKWTPYAYRQEGPVRLINVPWETKEVDRLFLYGVKTLMDLGIPAGTPFFWHTAHDFEDFGPIGDLAGGHRKNPRAKAWPLYHYIPFAERFVIRHKAYDLDQAYWQLRAESTPDLWREAAELAWQEKPWRYVDLKKRSSPLNRALRRAEGTIRDTLVLIYLARTMQIYDALRIGAGYRARPSSRGYIGGPRRRKSDARRNPQPFENYLQLAEAWLTERRQERSLNAVVSSLGNMGDEMGEAARVALAERAWEIYPYDPIAATGSGLYKPGGPRRGAPGSPPMVGTVKYPQLVNFVARTFEIYDEIAEGQRKNPAVAVERGAKSARKAGAVGKSTAVGNYVKKTSSRGDEILDFAAGPKARETKRLRKHGLAVTAWDLAPNFDPKLHDALALQRKWPTVMAANVVNVIELPSMVSEVLDELARVTRRRGRLVVNLPAKPRYSGITAEQLERELAARFTEVKRVAGTKKAPVFEARRPTGGSPSAKPWYPRRNPQEWLEGFYSEKEPPEWTRQAGATSGTCGATWFHRDSSWIVQHCGHPTANFPYYAENLETGEMLLEKTGRAFRHLKDAQAAVLERVAGDPRRNPLGPWPWKEHFDKATELHNDQLRLAGDSALTPNFTPEDWEWDLSDDRSHGNDIIANATAEVWGELDWTKHPWKQLPELFLARIFYEADRIELELMEMEARDENIDGWGLPRNNPSKKHQERAAAIAGELRKTLSVWAGPDATNAILSHAIKMTWSMRDWKTSTVEEFIAQLLEYLEYIEMLSLQEAWKEVQLPGEITLGQLCTMKNATAAGAGKGQDVYLWRISGTTDYVGRPQTMWHQNTIGVKIRKQFRSSISPRALFLYLAYVWRVGVFKVVAHGTVKDALTQRNLGALRIFPQLDQLPRQPTDFFNYRP